MKTDTGPAGVVTNTRWIGRAIVAPSATRITAPSPIIAVLSAKAGSSASGDGRLRRSTTSASPFDSASASDPIDRPGSSAARSERSAANTPSTITMRRALAAARNAPADLAFSFAAASGGGASGFASRISARRSVYFQVSTRRCGNPFASKVRNALSRSDFTAAAPGRVARAPAKASARPSSAAVLMTFRSAMSRSLYAASSTYCA